MSHICRICLEQVHSTDVFVLKNINTQMLEFLKVDMDITLSDNAVMCVTCEQRLQESFNFKTNSLNNFDYVITYKNDENTVINIEDIVNRRDYGEGVKLELEKVCLLCLKYHQLENLTCLSNLHEDWSLKDMIDKCIPEVDFALINEPYLCNGCLESLQNQFNFIVSCFDSEELIKSYVAVNDNVSKKIDLHTVLKHIKKLQQDSEKECGNEFINIKKEIESLSACIDIKSEPANDAEDVDLFTSSNERSGSPLKKSWLSPKIRLKNPKKVFACPYCLYQNHKGANLASHLLIHEKLGNVPTFNCNLCNFESKWRSSLLTHQLLHKKSTEVTIYKCYNCSYETKYKKHLRRHMKLHQFKWYYCLNCIYKTKLKSRLKMHKCKDKDIKAKQLKSKSKPVKESKIPINEPEHVNSTQIPYKEYEPDKIYTYFSKAIELDTWHYVCNNCEYKTNKICNMKAHVLRHQPKSDISFEKCHLCDYQTKYKRSLRAHMNNNHKQR